MGLRALAATVVVFALLAVFAAGAASAAAGLVPAPGTAAQRTAQTPPCAGTCWIPSAAVPSS